MNGEILNIDFNYLILVLVLGLGAGVIALIFFIYNQKFPIVKFLIFDGNNLLIKEKRLINNMVTTSDLLKILFYGRRLVGEDIRDFNKVYLNGKTYYLARESAGALIPLKYNEAVLNSKLRRKLEKSGLDYSELELIFNRLDADTLTTSQIKTARDVALRYIDTNEQIQEQLKQANFLMASLLPSLVVIIPSLVLILAFAIVFNNVGGVLKEVSNTLNAVSQQMVLLNEDLDTYTTGTNATSSVIIGDTNDLNISNPNLPTLGGG